MAPRRALRIDGVAWILLFTGSLVALTVFSHEPASDLRVADRANLLGPLGHWLASELFRAPGLRRLRLSGDLVRPGRPALVAKKLDDLEQAPFGLGIARPVPPPSPSIGSALEQLGPMPGGSIGALLHAQLGTQFSEFGGVLAVSSVACCAALLALDFLILRGVRTVWETCQFLGCLAGAPLRWAIAERPAKKKSPKLDPAPQRRADQAHRQCRPAGGRRRARFGRRRKRPAHPPHPARAALDPPPEEAPPLRRLRAAAADAARRPRAVPLRASTTSSCASGPRCWRRRSRTSASTSRSSASTPARSSRSTRSPWRPACASTRSPAWPTTSP